MGAGKVGLGLVLVTSLGAVLWAGQARCWSDWWTWGLSSRGCVDGRPRVVLQVEAQGLARGAEATIEVRSEVVAGIRGRPRAPLMVHPLDRIELSAALLDKGGASQPLACEWERVSQGVQGCRVTLPSTLPDGEHSLRLVGAQAFEEDVVVDLEVGFYAPALVHLLTDRPLYEPGEVVRFRALVLGEAGQGPIGARPGTWRVRDPEGRVVFEEPGETGPWGVAESDLPLPWDATSGAWIVSWTTGEDRAEVSVDVEPFTMPRAELSATAGRPWFKPGEPVVVEGRLRTLSGLAVVDAQVELELEATAGWPPPSSWSEVPVVSTDAEGVFAFQLEAVPQDLRELTHLPLRLSAFEEGVGTVEAGLVLVLSPDELAVDVLTELGSGLVPDLSNRLYARVGRPDGTPLRDTLVAVVNPWDPRSAPTETRTDVDGVLALNLDPGAPVQLLVPPPPQRSPPAPPEAPVFSLGSVVDLADGGSQAVDPAVALMAALEEPCGWRVDRAGRQRWTLSSVGGRVVALTPRETALDACAARALRGQPLPSGVFEAWVDVAPRASARSLELLTRGGAPPQRAQALLEAARQEALGCVQDEAEGGTWAQALHWSTGKGGHRLLVEGVRRSEGTPWTGGACVLRQFSSLALEEAAEEPGWSQDAQGVVLLSVQVPTAVEPPQPPGARTEPGFELDFAVEGVGSTTWRAREGRAPRLRLRPDAVLLEPGQAFTVQALRGPGHGGELPARIALEGRNLSLRCPRLPTEEELPAGCPDPEPGERFHLLAPEDPGFYTLEAEGAQATIWVRPRSRHTLALTSTGDTFGPGRPATIRVSTGEPAVVSLTGVDAALAQLRPLPGPDALARAVQGGQAEGVLGAFDSLGLVSGRIQGDNAALATIQRVQLRARAARKEPARGARGARVLGLEASREEAFWALVGEVRAATQAGQGELDHGSYAATWDALAPGHLDALGRPLSLARLPDALVELAEPRRVVVDAARLPEDIEPWLAWVRREL